MIRHFFNLALNIAVLAWVAWRGISDMLFIQDYPLELVAVVAAALYLLAVPFAWSLVRSVAHARRLRALRAGDDVGRTFE